jgi:hypothetical protein
METFFQLSKIFSIQVGDLSKKNDLEYFSENDLANIMRNLATKNDIADLASKKDLDEIKELLKKLLDKGKE